ncbi:MAG: type II toxin-antitoxin system HicA family toxin [Oscillospiraceae bacterium]|nr:type II toxin-antitoxin system HicA family toxin [Oscillospiraceae bacterium]
MAEYERHVRKILSKHGCTFTRHGKGDHDIWYSPITKRNVTVDGKIKSRHTANKILEESGIEYRFR